jgi:hypothetical protein
MPKFQGGRVMAYTVLTGTTILDVKKAMVV